MENNNINATFDDDFAKRLDKRLFELKAYDFYHSIKNYLPLLSQSIRGYKSQDIYFSKCDASTEEMIMTALLFYKDFDKELYNKLNKTLTEKVYFVESPTPFISKFSLEFYDEHIKELENKETILQISEPTNKKGLVNAVGNNFIKKYNRVFREINLNPSDDILGFVTIAHEFAHILTQSVQEMKKEKDKNAGEIESLFIEKVFIDWACKNGIFSEKEYQSCVNLNREQYLGNVILLLEEQDILSRLKPPITKEKLNDFEENLRGDRNYKPLMRRLRIMADGDRNGQRIFRYVVGKIIASELFKDYQENREVTTQKLKNFLNHNTEITLEKSAQLLLGDNYKDRIKNACYRGISK